ncbi:FtsK/SpoIIIE domain-containing protein [Actinophytocola algeriensis]|uniref:DNA segregation ATPase FtsK/SpoIIIE-like protein n=1 Tax=Actinophytocola algeriensis TaxID=1768010 RepID=A0A7W7Q7J7_9PSEU|nr:FtsK/SpoIIIE domain-containing protein [Actinophytocola algeriensis]MBB4908552.1 DNA segregation ATPase FtsK/SpoIIIE-like protein [Actinophytocola algeriensis]MBE1475061.1 DNA segregation ATPase FtsK/SpoIIIE-like protein [Actinophytocola algeriensis]
MGIRADGLPIELDLKDSSQDGMGPHGLLIGASGSGKTELLRTLVLALAVAHPPSSLNFMLVEFKGRVDSDLLDALPHSSGVITDLVADPHGGVDELADAVGNELARRQDLLRANGNFPSLRHYARARAAGAALPEMPTLLVIVDDFVELLAARPDFIDTFVQTGRLGRSLGVHLLLSARRLDEGRLRGLETHLHYRIGLRTSAAADSKAVLGVTDAFRLPRAPGHGYLKVGNDPLERFRSAHVSEQYRRNGSMVADPMAAEGGETLLTILVDRLKGHGPQAHRLWPPPASP